MVHSKTYLLFLTLLLLISCGRFSEITIGDISGVTVKGFRNDVLLIDVNIPVDNPTQHRITISDLDLRLSMNDHYVGKIQLDEKLVIPSNSEMVHGVTLQVQMANFISTGLMMMNMKKGQMVRFRLEGSITARSLLLKKEIPVDELREVII